MYAKKNTQRYTIAGVLGAGAPTYITGAARLPRGLASGKSAGAGLSPMLESNAPPVIFLARLVVVEDLAAARSFSLRAFSLFRSFSLRAASFAFSASFLARSFSLRLRAASLAFSLSARSFVRRFSIAAFFAAAFFAAASSAVSRATPAMSYLAFSCSVHSASLMLATSHSVLTTLMP